MPWTFPIGTLTAVPYPIGSTIGFTDSNPIVSILLKPFRLSGRFIWPLHYLALVFGVWGITRVFGSARQAAGTTLLALAVAVQAADVQVDPWLLSQKAFKQAPVHEFARAVGRYRRARRMRPARAHRRR